MQHLLATAPYFRSMIAQLTGRFLEISPTRVVIDVQGVGYEVHISLHTYTAIQGKVQGSLHTYLKVAEDAMTLFGFAATDEKEMFIKLIAVSGVGAATARMMLSSLKPAEVATAITSGDARMLERVKGIGKKTAERLVLELRDKISRDTIYSTTPQTLHNTMWQDALDALVALGIQRGMAEAALKKVQLSSTETESVEAIIKQVLKSL